MDQAYYEFELLRQERLSAVRFVWLPIGKALYFVTEAYKVEFELSEANAWDKAQSSFWNRLQSGEMLAKSNDSNFSNFPTKNNPERRLGCWGSESIIPLMFWEYLRVGKVEYADWIAGDFRYTYCDGDRHTDKVELGLFASASNVQVALHNLPVLQSWPNYDVTRLNRAPKIELVPTACPENLAAGKAPRLSDAALEVWWKNLDPENRKLPQAKLWELAKACFPRNLVSRDRIRALDPGRKPGPKRLGGKMSAE